MALSTPAPPYLPQVDALGDPRQDVEPVGRCCQAGHRPGTDDLLLQLVLGQRKHSEGSERRRGCKQGPPTWGLRGSSVGVSAKRGMGGTCPW